MRISILKTQEKNASRRHIFTTPFFHYLKEKKKQTTLLPGIDGAEIVNILVRSPCLQFLCSKCVQV